MLKITEVSRNDSAITFKLEGKVPALMNCGVSAPSR